jgi:phytanoyl-CoA hydroxylase
MSIDQSLDYPLTAEQVEFYRRNGYVRLPDVLTPEELDAARRGVDEAVRKREELSQSNLVDSDYARVFVQMVNLWQVSDILRPCVLSAKLASIAKRLSGFQSVRLWHDHALVKMPGDSKPSPWHQDLPYWPHDRSGSLSCWMALDDVTEENGCMWFVPGSHQWGRLEPISLTDPQDIFSLVPDPAGKDFTPVPQPLKAGSCTFHDSLLFHYAGPNRTERPRRALITIYMENGTRYTAAPHCVTDPLGLKAGDALEGDLFPVLA